VSPFSSSSSGFGAVLAAAALEEAADALSAPLLEAVSALFEGASLSSLSTARKTKYQIICLAKKIILLGPWHCPARRTPCPWEGKD
jgi:hypothetical protein